MSITYRSVVYDMTRIFYSYRCSYFTDSCHPDEGGDTFLRNVGSYKSHTA
jgi:hypothetical protein